MTAAGNAAGPTARCVTLGVGSLDHVYLVAELMKATLQSENRILRVAAYFAIPASEISRYLTKIQQVFQTRQEIAHEMDILLGQSNRGRR